MVEVDECATDDVELGVPDFGKYWIPVEGQFEDCPTGLAGTN
jgi:hypothetical protein